MIRRTIATAGAWVWLAACAGGTPPPPSSPAPADLVLRDARIYTVDASRSWASALAVRGDRLVAVGSARDVQPYVGPTTHIVDAGGRLVLPGFHDSHVHPISAGMEARRCDLNGLATRAAVLAAVKACVAADRVRPWVVGGGWDLTVFPGANPSKALLDAIEPSRPVYLSSADGHSAWVNSTALALAGVTRDTPDPPRGRIERDRRTGEPTGTLREAASGLVERLVPAPTAADYRAGLDYAIHRFAELGIVAAQDAKASPEMLDAYLEADREHRLTFRVRASQYVDPAGDVEQIEGLVAGRGKYRSPHLNAGTAKFFLDGVIEAKTAVLLEPYLGSDPTSPGARGLPNFAQDRLDRLVAGLDKVGFQVHMHAIGDGAIRMGLDAIAFARRVNGPRDARPHLAHIQLFDPADIPRFRELGAIANFQPLWAYEDSYIRDLTLPVLGPARSRWLYPIRSLLDSGAVVVAGSDWSVSSPDPLQGMEVAVTRREPGAPLGQAWIPEETVDLPRIITAYTIAGAYVSFEERDSGSLEAGKLADFVVLDRNLFDIPVNQIHAAKVLWTVFEGKEVYRSEAWKE